MPKWLELWRWYVDNCVWICSCGCTGPDCCDCCIWTTKMDQRIAKIIEKMEELRLWTL